MTDEESAAGLKAGCGCLLALVVFIIAAALIGGCIR